MIRDCETVDQFLRRELTNFYSKVIEATDACEGFTQEEKEGFLQIVVGFMLDVVSQKIDSGKIGFTFSTNDGFKLKDPK